MPNTSKAGLSLRQEFEYRIRTALTYGYQRGKRGESVPKGWVMAEVDKAVAARKSQKKNRAPVLSQAVEALNAEIAYLRQANLMMATDRDAWKDTALAHKARLDEFAARAPKPRTRKPEGPITTGIHTYAAPDGTYAASAKSLTVTGYRSRSGARHAMIRLLAESAGA